ncbi:hypothetical protein EIZ39_03550 [Ammoniphilus sp. CFH 90114]|nr:hypothetical protein EIZ39_03550 [Ammoniphilus sp. CFH 90114]
MKERSLMTHNPRDVRQLEQEASEQEISDRQARLEVEQALNHSIPQRRYQQEHTQQNISNLTPRK